MNNSFPFDRPAAEARAQARAWSRKRVGYRRDLIELSVGYGLIVAGLWMPRGPDTYLYWAALIWVIVTTAMAWPGLAAMGLREKGFLRSLWIVAAALGLCALGLWLGGVYHSLNETVTLSRVTHRYWEYSIWALVQEFVLLDYFLLRLCRVLPGSTWAVGVLAVLFAVCHIPNPVLVPLTLAWGAIAGVVFLRCRNLYTLGLAHAILGICIAIAVPRVMTHHMRVGHGYLTYRPVHRNPSDSVTGNTF